MWLNKKRILGEGLLFLFLSRSQLVVGLLLLYCLQPLRAAEYVIESIEFSGNKVTKDHILLQEMLFDAGDNVTDEQIEQARQSIMNLDLFKAVTSELVATESGHRLLIDVDEKHYWFIVPKLSRSGDGDVAYGGEFQIDNLAGRNQHLELNFRKKNFDDTDVDEEEQIELEFQSPRIFRSAFEFNLDIKQEQAALEEDRFGVLGNYDRELDEYGFTLARWKNPLGPSKGWRYFGGARVQQFDHTFLSGEPGLFFDADIFSVIGGFSFIDVQNYLFSREGIHYGYQGNLSTDSFGSDVSFARHSVFYRRFKRVTQRPHTNFNTQLRFGYTTRSIFGDPTYSVANGRSIRGFDRDSLEGDAFIIGNLQFLTPLYGKNALRGVTFLDFGNAYENIHEIDLSDLKFGAGIGLRWKVKSFVKFDLRLDVAHGFPGGELKVFAGTRTIF